MAHTRCMLDTQDYKRVQTHTDKNVILILFHGNNNSRTRLSVIATLCFTLHLILSGPTNLMTNFVPLRPCTQSYLELIQPVQYVGMHSQFVLFPSFSSKNGF